MKDIIFGACLLFCVPTCYLFWKFLFRLHKNEDNLVKKIFEDDFYE